MQMFDSFLNLRIVLRINIHGIELVDRVLWSRLRGMVSWNGFVERTSWNGLRGTGFVERASWNGLRGTGFVERASWNWLRGMVSWNGFVFFFSTIFCDLRDDTGYFRVSPSCHWIPQPPTIRIVQPATSGGVCGVYRSLNPNPEFVFPCRW